MTPHLLAFLAGLVSACGFQPIAAWPLTLAGFAVLLWLIGNAPRPVTKDELAQLFAGAMRFEMLTEPKALPGGKRSFHKAAKHRSARAGNSRGPSRTRRRK